LRTSNNARSVTEKKSERKGKIRATLRDIILTKTMANTV